VTSGTSLTQPLSELWKIKSANDVVAAELKSTRGKARQNGKQVALASPSALLPVLVLQSTRKPRCQSSCPQKKELQAGRALQAERVSK